MKRIVLYCIIGLMSYGCSTTKRVHGTSHIATDTIEQVDMHMESRQTTEMIELTETESTTDKTEEFRHVTLEFDTTQQVDSCTRIPPLKRITIIDRRRNTQAGIWHQTKDTVMQQVETTLRDSITRSVKMEQSITTQTEKKVGYPWHFLIVVACGIVLCCRLWRRHR